MSVLRNIIFRKVTALVLLALMLVIHGVKLFHEHAAQHKSYNSITPAIHAAAHHCAICDFQLTRDADIPVEQLSPAIIRSVVEIPAYFAVSYSTAHPSERCLRGPPVTC